MLTITNATKAQAIAVVNAVLGVLGAFNIGHLTHPQQGSLLVAANAVLAMLVGVTYKASKKRTSDVPASPPPPPVVPVP